MRFNRLTSVLPTRVIQSRYVCFAFPAVILVAISPLLQLAFSTHPTADDFCPLTNADQSLVEVMFSTVDHIFGVYFTWSGAYTSMGLQRLVPGLIDFTRYMAIIPISLMGLCFIFLLILVNTIFTERRTRLPSVLISLSCTILYLVTMPIQSQGIYWFTASISYFAGSIAFVLLLAQLIRLTSQDSEVRYLSGRFIALAVLLIVAIGFNEITMLSILAVMFGLTLREFFYSGPQRYPLLVLCILTIIFAGLYTFAPGNYTRAEHFPDRYNFWTSASDSFYWSFRKMGAWVSQPLLWITTIIVIACFAQFPAKTVACYRPNRIFILLYPVIAALFITMLFFPVHWATGDLVSGRVLNVIYFNFLLLWFWYCFIVFRTWLAFRNPALSLSRFNGTAGIVMSIALVTFSIAIYIHPTMRLSRLDLVGRAHAYHATNLERYRILENHNNSATDPVVVPAYQGDVPRTIYFDNLTSNPDHFINSCMARYFGVRSVRTDR